MRKTTVLLTVLVLLLALSSALAIFEFSNVLSLQNELSQRDKTLVDRDTLITQLDTAIRLAESLSKLKLPNASQYLTTTPDQNSSAENTKIFLTDSGVSISYLPAYPFSTPWFNGSGPFSSQRVFELTNNRSIALSFWGWWFNTGRMFGGVTGGGVPSLNIGVTVRNDYTSADVGAPIGNRTGSYISSVNLGIRLYSWNGSIVEVPRTTGLAAPTASSNTAMGGVTFLLVSGQSKEVIFYLSPSVSDMEAICYCEIYVSEASPY